MGTVLCGQCKASPFKGKLVASEYKVKIGTRDVAASKKKTQPDSSGNPAIGSWLYTNRTVELVTFAEAVSFSDGLIVHAMNGQVAIERLKSSNSKNLDGKILNDIINPLDFSKGMSPTLLLVTQKAWPNKFKQLSQHSKW